MTQTGVRPDYTQLIHDQYRILQCEHVELQKKYDLLAASSASETSHALPSRLLQLTKSLVNAERFADCRFRVAATQIPAHRFVLAARSPRRWTNLDRDAIVEVRNGDEQTFRDVYQWMYTDSIELTTRRDEQLMAICESAASFELEQLVAIAVDHLSSRLNPDNCVKIYEFAEKLKLDKLEQTCGAMVTANWPHFRPDHFDTLPAAALFRLITRNTRDVLRSIIEIARDDVLFLFFIQNSGQLTRMLNAWHDVDDKCDKIAALEICFSSSSPSSSRGLELAAQLIEKGANVEIRDANDESLLMRAIRRGSPPQVCRFLIENGADLKYRKPGDQSTCVHILAETKNNPHTSEILDLLLEKSADILDSSNYTHQLTPLMSAVSAGNFAFCSAMLRDHPPSSATINYAAQQHDGHTALSLALLGPAKCLKTAEMLVLNGAKASARTLRQCCHVGDIAACRILLDAGVDVEEVDEQNNGKTAVHLAVEAGNADILRELLDGKKGTLRWTKDAQGKRPLEVALNRSDLECARLMIEAGADVNDVTSSGVSLLATSILARNDEIAVFLIDNGAKAETQRSVATNNKSLLETCCESGMLATCRALIASGLELTPDLLEIALRSRHIDVAELLVKFSELRIDAQLLHRFLDDNDQEAATFLIRAGCDVDARLDNIADGDSPLHVAVAWSMTAVIRELVNRGARLDAQDANGRTAAHLACRERNRDALALLLDAPTACDFIPLRDKFGHTILSLAMMARDHAIAHAIVERQPHAAVQTNGNGENLLHSAIRQNDFESVLFLLAVAKIDVSRPVQDGTAKTPLHLAAVVQNEMIIRNLILACDDVNAQSADGCTPLHDALKSRNVSQARILLENRAAAAIRDENGENAFLCAVRSGSVECVRLLIQTDTNLAQPLKFDKNKLGMTCLHLCALLTPEKLPSKTAAVEICEMILQQFVEIDKNVASFIDARDLDGNTALMIAYSLGNATVCRSLLRRAACMGTRNNGDVNVFTYETATKQLLLGLLESLECEPRWSDGDACDCGARFSLTQRKHHCRHCGRHVCSRCSDTTMPIAKYGEEKRVRVCDVCCHVISGNRKI